MKNNGKMTVAFLVVGLLGLLAGGAGIAVVYVAGDLERYFDTYRYQQYLIAVIALAGLAFLLACCFAAGLSGSNRAYYRKLIDRLNQAEAAASGVAPISKPAPVTTEKPAVGAPAINPAAPVMTEKPVAEAPAFEPVPSPFAPEAPAFEATSSPLVAEKPAFEPTFSPGAPEMPAFESAASPFASEAPAFESAASPFASEAPSFEPVPSAFASEAPEAEEKPTEQVPAAPEAPAPALDAKTITALQKIKAEATELKALAKKTMDSAEETRDLVQEDGEDVPDVETLINEIDDIAFRAHLLSLNIAIETSNAGDPDGSLASIADDVRTIESKSVSLAGSCKAAFAVNLGVKVGDTSLSAAAAEIIHTADSILQAADSIEADNESDGELLETEKIVADPLPISPIDPGTMSGLFG